MSASSKAVFLSYASQDKDVAKRICDALRQAGVEVWFDQSELRGGDAWDQMIRKRIKECALFVPVITPTTNTRAEGYFRLEWKLAVDRSHLMADDAPFLFPIVVGDVDDGTARVPDKFRDVQWTRLRLDETPAELAARISRLLSGSRTDNPEPLTSNRAGRPGPARWQWGMIFPILGTVMGLLFAAIPVWKAMNRPPRESPRVAAPAVPAQSLNSSPEVVVVEQARNWPKAPELKKAFDIITALDVSVESCRLAEDLVNGVLKQRPTDPEATTIYAMLNNYFINRGFDLTEDRYVLARRFTERALQLAPEEPEAMAAMAQFLTFRRSDLPRAEQLARQAIALVPDEPRFSRILVYNVLYGYRTLDAVTEGKAACLRFPRDPLTQYNLALICRATGDMELMEQSLDRTLALAPVGSALIWKGWLTAWVHGDLPGFRTWLDKISGAFRLNERAIYMRYVYASLSRDASYGLDAVQSHSGAWMSDFYYNGPRSLLVADLYAIQGRAGLAREEYERALAEIRRQAAANPGDQNPDRAEMWVLLGLGRMDEARALARKIYEQQARPYLPIYMLWWHSAIPAQLLTGNRTEALTLVKEAAQLPAIRQQLRTALQIDPRMAPFRQDAEIQALLAEPAASAAPGNVLAATSAVSPARELANKALAILKEIDVTREDLALADDRAQQAVKLDPSDAEAWAASSIAHGAYIYRGWDTSTTRREQSRVAAERAIRLDPKSTNARLAQAGAWTSFNVNRAEVEKLLREILADRPDHQPTLRFLAVVVLGQGKLEEALALNERSAALPGGDPLALYNNGRYLLQAGREDEAIATLDRSIAQKPMSSALVMKTLMEIYRKGDLAAAEATQKRIPAVVLLEDRANYISGLLRYYRRDAEGALRIWNSFPRDAYADFQFEGPKGILIGYAYELDGREAAAKIEWRTALQLADQRLAAAPNSPRRHYDRALLLACLGETKAAEEALRTHEQLAGIKLAAGAPLPSYDLAVIYARLGRFDELLAHWPAGFATRMRLDPRFDQVRADPRFATLLK